MVNIAVIGDMNSGKTSLCSKLGKKGTDSDITFYNNVKHDQKYVYIESKTYPKTLKSLVSSINLSDIVILCVEINNITQYTGECIVILDLLNVVYGVVVITKSDNSYNSEIESFIIKLKQLLKDTCLDQWPVISINTNKDYSSPFKGLDKLQDKILEYSSSINRNFNLISALDPRIVIDHYFNVTGIGIVVLGKVIQGTIHVHDKFILYPREKNIEIRSIQKNDINSKEALPGDRVGLGLKGVLEKELTRGCIISHREKNESSFKLKIRMARYSFPIKSNDIVHLFVGLQNEVIKINNIESQFCEEKQTVYSNNQDDYFILTCQSEKAISYSKNDVAILANLENKQRFLCIGYFIS